MRSSTLIEVGDIYAKRGSRQWAAGMRLELWRLLFSAEGEREGLGRVLNTFEEFEGWKVLEDAQGKPFASFQAFCLAPRPHGLGVTRRLAESWRQQFEWAEAAQALAGPRWFVELCRSIAELTAVARQLGELPADKASIASDMACLVAAGLDEETHSLRVWLELVRQDVDGDRQGADAAGVAEAGLG